MYMCVCINIYHHHYYYYYYYYNNNMYVGLELGYDSLMMLDNAP